MDTTTKPLSPIDKVLADVVVAMDQWSSEQSATLEAAVRDRLNKHRDDILMKLMGFNKGYNGRWEIDHCNGRSGNSNISDFLKESQGAVVKEWLSQIKLPVMSDRFRASIEKTLRDTYEAEIRRGAYAMAVAQAQKDLAALLDNVLTPTLLEKYRTMQELINPKPSTENT